MSFLTPLYILGALTVAAPILFHLIRRTPKGEVPFSSLMFLAPTPPRLTRRSRLDQLLLLALRAGALILLALAFARPFLRQVSQLDLGASGGRRLVVLLDTSASLRRGNLWERAKAQAAKVIDEAQPADRIAIYAFDNAVRPVLTFAESATLDPARRPAVARARLDALKPTWNPTDLGQALVDAVSTLNEQADATEKAARMPRRVVLVSDLQQGSRLEALGSFEWPADVDLEIASITPTDGSNAGAHWLVDATDAPAEAAGAPVRVRVTNEAGARKEAFQLTWVDARGRSLAPATAAYVPPGESRVVKVALPAPTDAPAARALQLAGDVEPFDNTLHRAVDAKEEAVVLFVGNDRPDDANGLLYYLERVLQDTPRRTVRVETRKPSDPLALDPARPPALVVVGTPLPPANAAALAAYMKQGGIVVDVVISPGPDATLGALAGVAPVVVTEPRSGRDVLLGEIAFDHPLFVPLAGAQFNDFTKIRFWKYRRVAPEALGEARVVARFEGGDPAIIEKAVGPGRLVILTSGWAPADSQLARSSKFVPLMAGLLEGPGAAGQETGQYLVGDAVTLPARRRPDEAVSVTTPSGQALTVAPGTSTFKATAEPGVYTAKVGNASWSFAVNLDPAESRTAPLAVETLQQLGCKLAGAADAAPDAEQLRQLQNAELEGRQKLWRWLIVAATVFLIVETWLAGRQSRTRPALAEVQAS